MQRGPRLTANTAAILREFSYCNRSQTEIRFEVIAELTGVHTNTVRNQVRLMRRRHLIKAHRPYAGVPYRIEITPLGRALLGW